MNGSRILSAGINQAKLQGLSVKAGVKLTNISCLQHLSNYGQISRQPSLTNSVLDTVINFDLALLLLATLVSPLVYLELLFGGGGDNFENVLNTYPSHYFLYMM